MNITGKRNLFGSLCLCLAVAFLASILSTNIALAGEDLEPTAGSDITVFSVQEGVADYSVEIQNMYLHTTHKRYGNNGDVSDQENMTGHCYDVLYTETQESVLSVWAHEGSKKTVSYPQHAITWQDDDYNGDSYTPIDVKTYYDDGDFSEYQVYGDTACFGRTN